MAPKPIYSAYKCRSHLGFSLAPVRQGLDGSANPSYRVDRCRRNNLMAIEIYCVKSTDSTNVEAVR